MKTAAEAAPNYRVAPARPELLAAPDGDEDVIVSDLGSADVETRQMPVSAALHGQRLDKAVVAAAPEFSRSRLQTLIEEGHVRLDGGVMRVPSRRVLAGQRLEVALVPTAESQAFRPETLPLAIVHEDADVLVIDKAAGMVVHPAAGNWTGTLLNGLLAHHPAAATLPRAGIVHRLDKDTTGLMVVGKTLQAVTALTRDIGERSVRRHYLALVHGEVRALSFTVEAPLGRDPHSRVRMAVVPSGRASRTDVTCVTRRDGFSALRCTLHTGRTHQIRVHLASCGHPLVGDATYGGASAFGMERQALHAARLGFRHPRTGAPMLFETAPPADLAAAWHQLTGARASPGPA